MPNQQAMLVVDLDARSQIASLTQAFQSHERVSLSQSEAADRQRSRMEDKLDELGTSMAKRLDAGIKDLDARINRVHGFMFTILWTGACSLIIMLLAIIGFFVAPFFLHH